MGGHLGGKQGGKREGTQGGLHEFPAFLYLWGASLLLGKTLPEEYSKEGRKEYRSIEV